MYDDHEVAGILLARDLDTIDREKIAALQQHNLACTVTAARRSHSTALRYPALALVSRPDDLGVLAPLAPAELAAGCPPHSDEFLFDSATPGLVLRSSGTASRAKVVYHSWAATDRVTFLGARGVRAAGCSTPRRIANCLLAGEFGGAFLFAHAIAGSLPAFTLPMGSRMPVEEAARTIVEHGVDTLVATPGYGTELVATQEIGPLRSFLYIGEAIGEQRSRLIRAAAPILAIRSLAYSTSETGPIGYQCAHQEAGAHHVHEDAVIVEVLDEAGRSQPEGAAGEVVVTPLTTSGMALFRYRVGDRGYLTTEKCRCGSAARTIVLLGRDSHSLNVDGTTISTDQLLGRLATLGISSPSECQLQILWSVHRYRVRLLLSPADPLSLTSDDVREALRGAPQLYRVITGPRCSAFSVEHVTPHHFARSAQGKVPVLLQSQEAGSA